MAPRVQEYKTLLNFVGLLHKAHEGDRPRPFNLFSVLRGARDEVRLHSRFLAALLDHRDHRTKGQENLKDFLRAVLSLKDDRFECAKSKVEKERSNIDILITLGDRVAIVIENKIDHQDSRLQLYTYWKRMKGEGFEEIHLVYLTPFGTPPSEGSIGPLNPDDVILVSYSSNTFQDWLRNCQRRAFDEPELRGSIVQYLRLVQDLTGTDRKGGYMDALKELLKEGNNLSLATHISEAVLKTRIDLELDLWRSIRKVLMEGLGDFQEDGPGPGRTLCEAVRNCHRGSQRKYYYGIVRPIPGYETMDLRVCIDPDEQTGIPKFCYGVSGRYRPEKPTDGTDEYVVARELVEEHLNASEYPNDRHWPYWQYARITRDAAMSSQEDANELIEEIAEEMKGICKAVSASPGE